MQIKDIYPMQTVCMIMITHMHFRQRKEISFRLLFDIRIVVLDFLYVSPKLLVFVVLQNIETRMHISYCLLCI